MIKALIFLNFIIYNCSLLAQDYDTTSFPEVGKPCPNFQFNDVKYYPKHQASLTDFRGKWLVLDFWNQYCSSCIESFPKINSFQSQTGESVNYLLVGYTGSQYSKVPNNSSIRTLFENIKQKANLQLPIAFDSLYFEKFEIYSCPYIIIIDPNGIVQGITYSLTLNDMRGFLKGLRPELPKAWRKNENKISYDPQLPFLVNRNGGEDTDYLFRSLLSSWKDYMPLDVSFKIINNHFQLIGVDLASLYRYAYSGLGIYNFDDSAYGKVFPFPVLEINDSTLFDPDYRLRKNIFSYCISFPSQIKDRLIVMRKMRRDLQNYFEYDVHLEERKMSYWKLVLIEKTSKKESKDRAFKAKTYRSKKSLLRDIYTYNLQRQLILIDETNTDDKIELNLSCDFNDFNDLKRSLQLNGLDLVQDEKEMMVIIISDKNIPK